MNEYHPLAKEIKRVALEYGNFTLKSGAKSHYYLDIRKLALDSRGLKSISDFMLAHIHQSGVKHIGGPTVGADPIIAALLMRTTLKMQGFLIRSEEKDHGLSGRVIGHLPPPGAYAIVIDDVLTSGGSVLDTIKVLQSEGVHTKEVMVVVDRCQGGAERILSETGVAVRPVLTIHDIGIEPAPEPDDETLEAQDDVLKLAT